MTFDLTQMSYQSVYVGDYQNDKVPEYTKYRVEYIPSRNNGKGIIASIALVLFGIVSLFIIPPVGVIFGIMFITIGVISGISACMC